MRYFFFFAFSLVSNSVTNSFAFLTISNAFCGVKVTLEILLCAKGFSIVKINGYQQDTITFAAAMLLFCCALMFLLLCTAIFRAVILAIYFYEN